MTDFDANNSSETGDTTTEISIEDRLGNYFGQSDKEPNQEVTTGSEDTATDLFVDFLKSGDEQPETDSEADEQTIEDDGSDATSEVTQAEPTDDLKIKIGDEELTYGELKNGYFRQADYTRKTQELASQKANLEQSQLAANQLIQKEVIDHMRRAYQVELMGEPNWAELRENDPFGYADAKENWEIKMAKFAELELLERNMHQQRVDAEARQFTAMQAKAREEFFSAHPEFKDTAVGKTHINGMVKYLSDLGFSNEEIEGVADSRMLKIVYQAYKANTANQQLESARETVASRPKINAPKSAGTRSDYSIARAQLRKTGSTEDAIKALSALF